MSDAKTDDHELSQEELKAIEEKYDEAAATRPVSDRMHMVLRAVAIAFATYEFLTAGFSLPAEHWHMGWFLAGLFILDAKDIARDLDQIAFQFTSIPFIEDFVQLIIRKTCGVFEQEIRFADQLHVAIFDAVVHHFHVVTGTAWPNPFATRNVIIRSNFGGNGLKDRLDDWPRFFRTTGHETGALESSFFASRNAGADKQ